MDGKIIKEKNIVLTILSGWIGSIACIICSILFIDSLAFGIGVGILILILSIVYPIIVFSMVTNEINIMCEEDGEHLMPFIVAILLGIVTFGIFLIYYFYRMQTRLHENAGRYNVNISESGGSIILWWLILFIIAGLGPYISMAIILRSFNKLARGYNKTLGLNPEHGSASPVEPVYPLPKSRQGSLRCVAGSLLGASVILEPGDVIVIGRDPHVANLIVDDPKVSKKHCSVVYDGERDLYFIVDYSSNGTTLEDGTKLVKEAQTPVERNTNIVLSKSTMFKVG